MHFSAICRLSPSRSMLQLQRDQISSWFLGVPSTGLSMNCGCLSSWGTPHPSHGMGDPMTWSFQTSWDMTWGPLLCPKSPRGQQGCFLANKQHGPGSLLWPQGALSIQREKWLWKLPKIVTPTSSHFSTQGARGPAKGPWLGYALSQPLNLPRETHQPQGFTENPAEQGFLRQDKLKAEEQRSVTEGEYLSKTPQELLEQIRMIPKTAIFPAGMTPHTIHRSICVPKYSLAHSLSCSSLQEKSLASVRVAELGNILAFFGLPKSYIIRKNKNNFLPYVREHFTATSLPISQVSPTGLQVPWCGLAMLLVNCYAAGYGAIEQLLRVMFLILFWKNKKPSQSNSALAHFKNQNKNRNKLAGNSK